MFQWLLKKYRNKALAICCVGQISYRLVDVSESDSPADGQQQSQVE